MKLHFMWELTEIYFKLASISSEIGSKEEWKNRNKRLKKYQKLLKNKRSVFLQLDQ